MTNFAEKFLRMIKEDKTGEVEYVIWPDGRRMAKSLGSIQKMFGVSYPTALRYSKTILRESVVKQGGLNWVDIDKAMEIFSKKEE